MSSGEQSVKQYRGPYPFRQEWTPPTVESVEVYGPDGNVRATYISPEVEGSPQPFHPPVPNVEYVEHESGVTYVIHKDKQ